MENNNTEQKEIWTIGKHKSCVVSNTKVQNTNFPSPPNPTESEESELEYYGGYLVCESIANSTIASLISLAPEMIREIKTFCERVDKGEVKSKKTYSIFKSIIERYEQK